MSAAEGDAVSAAAEASAATGGFGAAEGGGSAAAAEAVDVVVVGGGPSGLATATALREAGVARVVVLDREAEAGGIPRHSDHPGYGLRDLRRPLSGPGYARAWVRRAVAAGAQLRTSSTVTGWDDDLVVSVTSPGGRYALAARAVVLATGCRERPRSARLVPGDRPAGVLTTGQLQQLVHLEHRRAGEAGLGTRAVVVGAEHVSYSAVVTLAEAGVTTVAMVTELPRSASYAVFDRVARGRWRFPLLTGARVSGLHGPGTLEAVEVERLADGRRRLLDADTVVFTGDWVADHELARRQGIDVDRGSTGPRVDAAMRTGRPGVFAVGNLVHPAETADVCALDGRHVAAGVVSWLGGQPWPAAGTGVDVVVEEPLLWVAPSRLTGGARPARGRLLLRSAAFLRAPRLVVSQGGRELARVRLPFAVPTRPVGLPAAGWWDAVDLGPDAAPVTVTLAP